MSGARQISTPVESDHGHSLTHEVASTAVQQEDSSNTLTQETGIHTSTIEATVIAESAEQGNTSSLETDNPREATVIAESAEQGNTLVLETDNPYEATVIAESEEQSTTIVQTVRPSSPAPNAEVEDPSVSTGAQDSSQTGLLDSLQTTSSDTVGSQSDERTEPTLTNDQIVPST